MDRPISKGDLVQVIRTASCCGKESRLGAIFKVADIEYCKTQCNDCGGWMRTINALEPTNDDWFELRQLKRIDPPAQPAPSQELEVARG